MATRGAAVISLNTLIDGWNTFFFAPEDPLTLGIVRILLGLVCALNALTRLLAVPELYAPDSMVPWESYRQSMGWPRFSLLRWMPPTARSASLVLFAELCFALLVTFGFCSRVSCACLYVLMTSMHHRNMDVLDASDTIIRLFLFLICFSPCGAAASIDSLVWQMPEQISPWALRLLQIQLCLIYVQSVRLKLTGPLWRNGTAAWYPLQLERFIRIPYPRRLFGHPLVLRSVTWGVLAVEFLTGILIWVSELRMPVIAIAFLLHVGFACFLQLRLFSFVMCIGLVSFIPSSFFRSLLPAT